LDSINQNIPVFAPTNKKANSLNGSDLLIGFSSITGPSAKVSIGIQAKAMSVLVAGNGHDSLSGIADSSGLGGHDRPVLASICELALSIRPEMATISSWLRLMSETSWMSIQGVTSAPEEVVDGVHGLRE
jgi:hypothetical protein